MRVTLFGIEVSKLSHSCRSSTQIESPVLICHEVDETNLKAIIYLDRFQGRGDVGVNAIKSSITPVLLHFGLFILRPDGDYGLTFGQGSG